MWQIIPNALVGVLCHLSWDLELTPRDAWIQRTRRVKLLTGESYDEAIPIAQELDDHNLERQEIQNKIQEQAIAIIEKNNDHKQKKGLVVAHKDWHRGVVGIVASRILNRYYRPVFVLAIEGDEAHGSGRCVEGMNLADSLNACDDLLVKHGGHQAAAGLTIKTENIDEFADRFNQYACDHLSDEDLVPRLKADLEIQSSYLTLQSHGRSCSILNLLEWIIPRRAS